MRPLHLISTLILLVVFPILAYSQNLVSNGGDYHQTPEYSISYSIGETSIETYSADEITLTQGFQQSQFTISDISQYMTEKSISVYPNPTNRFLNIDLSNITNESVIILQGSNGQTIEVYNPELEIETINMEKYPPGLYYIQIITESKTYTFKIVKH